LVPGWLARERQLLHPVRALSREHPGITRSLRDDREPYARVMAATNKNLANKNKSRSEGKATKEREIRQPTLIR
jgi:hypothetical protein